MKGKTKMAVYNEILRCLGTGAGNVSIKPVNTNSELCVYYW